MNAAFIIVVTPLSKFTLSSEEHLVNAKDPITLTACGIVTVLIVLFFSKAPL